MKGRTRQSQEKTFSIFFRPPWCLRCFLGRGAPSSSSLSSPPLGGLEYSKAFKPLLSSSCQAVRDIQQTYLLFFFFLSPSSLSSCSLPLPLSFLFFFLFKGKSSSESSFTKSSMSPFLRLKINQEERFLVRNWGLLCSVCSRRKYSHVRCHLLPSSSPSPHLLERLQSWAGFWFSPRTKLSVQGASSAPLPLCFAFPPWCNLRNVYETWILDFVQKSYLCAQHLKDLLF